MHGSKRTLILNRGIASTFYDANDIRRSILAYKFIHGLKKGAGILYHHATGGSTILTAEEVLSLLRKKDPQVTLFGKSDSVLSGIYK